MGLIPYFSRSLCISSLCTLFPFLLLLHLAFVLEVFCRYICIFLFNMHMILCIAFLQVLLLNITCLPRCCIFTLKLVKKILCSALGLNFNVSPFSFHAADVFHHFAYTISATEVLPTGCREVLLVCMAKLFR